MPAIESNPKITPRTKPQNAPLKIGFLLADRFTLSAFANFIDVLRLASDEGDRSRHILCDWEVLSHDMNPIRSSCGVKIQPDAHLRNAGRFDYIAVVGGLIGDDSALPPAANNFLCEQGQSGVPLIGLCTGVFILHEEGLLDGYEFCVSWFHHHDFVAKYQGSRPVSDQIFVVDRNRLTCSGGLSAAHLAAFLVDRHIGKSAATKSLNIMIIEAPMRGERAQPGFVLRRTSKDKLVTRALSLMQQSIDAPLTIEELALRLNVGRRKLERHFNRDLDISPRRASLEIRLDHARGLLKETERSITDIAISCGFCDTSHFNKSFKADSGKNPSEYRKLNAQASA